MDYKHSIEITSQIEKMSFTAYTKKKYVVNGNDIVRMGWAAFTPTIHSLILKNKDDIVVVSNYYGDEAIINIVSQDQVKNAAMNPIHHGTLFLLTNSDNIAARIKLLL